MWILLVGYWLGFLCQLGWLAFGWGGWLSPSTDPVLTPTRHRPGNANILPSHFEGVESISGLGLAQTHTFRVVLG